MLLSGRKLFQRNSYLRPALDGETNILIQALPPRVLDYTIEVGT